MKQSPIGEIGKHATFRPLCESLKVRVLYRAYESNPICSIGK